MSLDNVDVIKHSRIGLYGLIDKPTPDADGKWELPTIYKEDIGGEIQVWKVGFNGTDRLIITSGSFGGVPVISTPKVEINRNGLSLSDQAFCEARHRFVEKFRMGYRQNLDADNVYREAMLAETYDSNKTTLIWPEATQPKLDGMRMLVGVRGREVFCRSRSNTAIPNMTHIAQELMVLLGYLPPGVELDGELYRHGYKTNHVLSVVRRNDVHPDLCYIIYYIFDMTLANVPYEERHRLLKQACDNCLADGYRINYCAILGYDLVYSMEQIYQNHHRYVFQGYEGTIIRRLGTGCNNQHWLRKSYYFHGRCDHLLKLKDFFDEEGTVVGVEQGSGTEEGAAMLVIRDDRGNIIPVRMCESFEVRRQWYQQPQLVLGRRLTFRYGCLTPYGVPRDIRGVGFRDPLQ